MKLAGHYVAFVAGGGGHEALATLIDLTTGRRVLADPATDQPITAIELSSRGRIAWIRRVDSGTSAVGPTYVVATGTVGGVTELDRGPAIAPRSLAIGGGAAAHSVSTVYWMDAGQPRAARF